MPIDFNRQLIFDPKIDIIGKEVPLAEIEKTGNVLQGRYDQSYEQYSLADAALKQMEASANEVDREKAAELRKSYGDQMKEMLNQGDFHNMRHQTADLARNAAMNYKVIGDKNAQIQKNLDEIAKNPKYRLDPEGAKKEYLKSLKSINVNLEDRTISDFNVNAYNGVADVNIAEKLLPIAPSLRAKYLNAKGSYFDTETAPNGQKVLVVRTQSGGVEKLPAGEIERDLLAYIKTDPEVQAYIKRDVGRAGLDPNSPEGIAEYQKLLLERTQDTTKALGNMYEINKDTRSNTFSLAPAELAASYGYGAAPAGPGTYSPVDAYQDQKTQGKLEFPDLLNSALQNNKKSRATLLSSLDYMAQHGNQNAVKAKEVVKGLIGLAEEYPEYADIIRRSTAGQYDNPLGTIGQAVYNVAEYLKNYASTGGTRANEVEAKGQKLVDQYKELANSGSTSILKGAGFLDSDFENEFEAATNSAPVTRKLPINSINLESDQVRTAVGKLSNDLNINKFDILEGTWGDPTDLKVNITGVSKEPWGAGNGIAFELMDSKGHTVIATPKKQAYNGIIGELNKVIPGLTSANRYREMVPLTYAGQEKDFFDIGKEIGDPQLAKQFKGYKLTLNEDGSYTRTSPNGETATASSPILLLPNF